MKLVCSLMILSLFACSSNKKKEIIKEVDNSETIKKDYVVTDASYSLRPGWIADANLWASENKEDTKTFRFFSFETEPKVGREIACNLAKANTRSDIASEITTFIQKSLGESVEGQASIDPNNPITQPLRNFVENNLVEKIEAVITGSALDKTYWEKRQYKKDLGSSRDFVGFTCASLIKVKHEIIQQAIDQVRVEMLNRAQNSDLKAKVQSAMEKAEDNYKKLRGL